MDYGQIYFLVVGVPILLGVFAVIAFFHLRHVARVRRDELGALAVARGLAFDPKPPDALCRRYGGFAPFKGLREWAENLLHGPLGNLQWEVFDYTYSTGGKNRTHHRFGIVAALVDRQFPNLRIRPERWYDALAKMAGWHDVVIGLDPSGAGDFDRRYHVASADPDLARRLLSPELVRYLMRLPDYHWQFAGSRVVIHRRGFFPLALIPEVMAAVDGFLDLIPDGVLARAVLSEEVAANEGDSTIAPSMADGRQRSLLLVVVSVVVGIGLLVLVWVVSTQVQGKKQREKRYDAVVAEIADRKSDLIRLERDEQMTADDAASAPTTNPATLPMRDGRIDTAALTEQLNQIQKQSHREGLLTRLAEVRRRLAELESEREVLEGKR